MNNERYSISKPKTYYDVCSYLDKLVKQEN
ncbi:DUF3895 domain-containing protein [Fictibacillus sp. KIGAM418]|uniref:DUF3895 domain-containing protein n=1 Tax=Fictibacillus marinisediminis TaxID=2878389 RepID=A0A9X1XH35_9BACL|nr:DUF3895 domain-containing protein [Fictibacillus marinisediminis]